MKLKTNIHDNAYQCSLQNKMKIELSAALLGLLAVNNALGAQLIQQTAYLQEGCSGERLFDLTHAVTDQCKKLAPTTSIKYGCSESETFLNGNCEGSGFKAPVLTSCTSINGLSTKFECLTVPDDKIIKIAKGFSCSNGEVVDTSSEAYIVLDKCASFGFNDDFSYKVTVDDGGLTFTLFTEKIDCTGPSESETIPLGTCALSSSLAMATRRLLADDAGKIAVKVTPAVEGTTLGGGNASTSTSAGISIVVLALIAAWATVA